MNRFISIPFGSRVREASPPTPQWAGASRSDAPAPDKARKGLLRASVSAPFLTPAERGRGQRSALTLPLWREFLFGSLGSTLNARSASAFTLMEIAICLAVISFALIAIIGVLPLGMNVQRENREATLINQDATVFLEAIGKGAQGLDDLTNYVYAITNHWSAYNAGGGFVTAGDNGYTYNSSTVSCPISQGSLPLNTGYRIVGLLSTPQLTDANGQPIDPYYTGNYYSNHVVAYVRALSGAASEKPPQDNDIIRGGVSDSGDSFAYRLLCVNAPVPMEGNVPVAEQAYGRQLAANLRELRLTFFWPLLPNGKTGLGRQTFRTLIPGRVETNLVSGQILYFYQPQSFTNAP